ncbi:hypothetical protein ALC62_11182 [Cyphomyrmex costatus]|uniref:Uncharacterized protein n=1 Tax=Cyphomyrmex costatus TaxID=456900 RepID=A0A195CDA2_9HYME|nr:hypothetical protein ALC62_11182 [Cyphomyrmex costatus]
MEMESRGLLNVDLWALHFPGLYSCYPEQEGRGIPSVLAYGSSRISKTELNTPRGHREFPPHQPHPRSPRHPIAPQPVPYPSAKRHGSHGGSYGINKSGAHAPQLPLLLPSATTSRPPSLPLLFVAVSTYPSLFVSLPFAIPRSLDCSFTPRAISDYIEKKEDGIHEHEDRMKDKWGVDNEGTRVRERRMAFARADWCLSSYYKFMAVGEANADQPRVRGEERKPNTEQNGDSREYREAKG